MRRMGVREFRASFGSKQEEPIAVTRHGWIVGVYYPYNDLVHPPPEMLGASIIQADLKTAPAVKEAAQRTLAGPAFNSRPFRPTPKRHQ